MKSAVSPQITSLPDGCPGCGSGCTGGVSGAPATAALPGARRAPAWSGVAHSEQNFAVGGLIVPQFGQPAASGVAHSEQNFAPGRFSVAQFGQITVREHTDSERAQDRRPIGHSTDDA